MQKIVISLLFAVALSACKSFGGGGSCGLPPEYNSSVSIPPLKVPAGYELPDTNRAMRVPELDTPEKPRNPDEPCLDYPPKYAPPAKPAPPQA